MNSLPPRQPDIRSDYGMGSVYLAIVFAIVATLVAYTATGGWK